MSVVPKPIVPTIHKWHGYEIYTRNSSDDTVVHEQLSYLRKLDLRPDDVVLDLGGNIGATAVVLAPYVKSFVAVEPEPDNVRLYKQNTRHNNVQTVLYEGVVVGNSDTTRTLYLADKNFSCHSLVVHGGRQGLTVPAININTLLQKHTCQIWKIDVEGAEYEILRAIEPEYWDAPRELMFEFHHSMLHDSSQEKYREIIDLLGRHFPHVSYNHEPKKTWHSMVLASKERIL